MAYNNNSYQEQNASSSNPTREEDDSLRALDYSHVSINALDLEKPTNEYVLNVAFFSFLGFTLLQTGFAIMAKSQAMLADSEAMFVDALTYLFNLLAERLKRRPYSEKEIQLPSPVRHHRRKLMRLYLELIPPLISVCALMGVTIITLRDSMRTLMGSSAVQPDLTIMLLFSGANLILDVVNVFYFARADQAIGLMHSQGASSASRYNDHSEGTSTSERDALVRSGEGNQKRYAADGTQDRDDESVESEGINLNMCSAWTHVFADTLRSIAVLIAAGIAFVWDELSPDVADAIAAIVVSFIIIFSLLPLVQGLYFTAYDIWVLSRGAPATRQGLTIVV